VSRIKRRVQAEQRATVARASERANRHLNNLGRSAFIPEIFPDGAAVFLLCIIARGTRSLVGRARSPRNTQTPFSGIAICFMVARNIYRGPSRRAKERE